MSESSPISPPKDDGISGGTSNATMSSQGEICEVNTASFSNKEEMFDSNNIMSSNEGEEVHDNNKMSSEEDEIIDSNNISCKEDEMLNGGCVMSSEDDMFNRIAQSSAVIKSQQRGDKELTLSDKIEHLKNLYNKTKITVLRRFGNHMNLTDLDLFNEPESYEMQYYVNKFRIFLDPVKKDQIIKNRRYNYLKNVLRETDYFDDVELEKRNPLLYKQYIGQYISENEVQRSSRLQGRNFSEYLFSNIDRSMNNFRCDLEQDASQDVENDEDSDDGDIENDEDFKKYLEEQIPMGSDERAQLRQEFLCLMENNFLVGDENFDYNVVDYDEQYDDLRDQDIEDHYFDEEDSNL